MGQDGDSNPGISLTFSDHSGLSDFVTKTPVSCMGFFGLAHLQRGGDDSLCIFPRV